MRTLLLAGMVAALAGACAGHRTASTAPRLVEPVTEAGDFDLGSKVSEADMGDALEPAEAEAPAADAFKAQIAPLLAQKCAPCHNPGGKMYATMPFDDPATITSHAAGILRRIKTPDEHALIEQWIASQPKS